jgi:hypothetical protein
MANWQRTLRIGDISGDAPLAEKARGIADALEALKPFPAKHEEVNEQREDLVNEFRSLANDPAIDEELFDELMEQLYDWADTPLDANWPPKKVCWINAMSRT